MIEAEIMHFFITLSVLSSYIAFAHGKNIFDEHGFRLSSVNTVDSFIWLVCSGKDLPVDLSKIFSINILSGNSDKQDSVASLVYEGTVYNKIMMVKL